MGKMLQDEFTSFEYLVAIMIYEIHHLKHVGLRPLCFSHPNVIFFQSRSELKKKKKKKRYPSNYSFNCA